MAMKGDYIGKPAKGALFFAREMALSLRNYMEVCLIGRDVEGGEKGVWRNKRIGGEDFPFFDPYVKSFVPLGQPLDTFFALHLAWKRIESIEPDILYLQEINFLPLAKLAKPTVVHIHGCFKEMVALRYPPLWQFRRYLPVFRTNYLQGRIRLRLLKRYLPLLSKIFISANSGQIAYFKEREPGIGAKLLSIPLSINTNLFQPMGREKAREILGLPKEHFIVLFVGGLDPLKSPQLLLQSFAIFKKHFSKSLLLFIGKGSLEELLHHQAKSLGLEKDVLFIGRVPNEKLPLFYNASDIFALPSLYEGISTVALEALACGTPIIITSVIGVSEFINNGVQGFIIKEADKEELAEALFKAREFPQQTRELCREVALQFSSQRVGKMVYESLLSLLS